MTDQQIIDNNILVAEFMKKWDMQFEISIEKLQYHKDWNWLMPVVEKIGNISISPAQIITVEITNGYTLIRGRGIHIYYNASIEKSMLAATYKAIVEFIRMYNKEGK